MLNDHKQLTSLMSDTAIFDVLAAILRESGLPGCRIEYATLPGQEPTFTVKADRGTTLRGGMIIHRKYLNVDLVRLQQAISESLHENSKPIPPASKAPQLIYESSQVPEDFIDPPF